jgi:hypothetical protein
MSFQSSSGDKQINQEFIIKSIAAANGGIPMFSESGLVESLVFRTTVPTSGYADEFLATVGWVINKLTAYAPISHTHTISDVTGLQTALDNKEGSFDILGVIKGGTGLSTAPSNGRLLIGNGTGYTLANLTAGSNITITNGAGSITIANTYSYSHPTGDGNLHVPVTSTTNNGRFLKAGSSAGSISWALLTTADLTALTASMAVVTDGSGKLAAHANVSATELGYLDGVTSAIQTQLNAKENTSNKNVANGYAGLDGSTKIPTSLLPDAIVGQVYYKGTYNASTNSPALPAANTTQGNYYVVSVAGTQQSITFAVGDWVISNGTTWEKVDNTDAVTSVYGRMGAITAAAGDYTASQVSNIPAGNIAATTVQDAINELDLEKSSISHNHSLASLTDTTLATPAAGHVLRYDGAVWRNVTGTNGQLLIGTGTGFNIATLTAGSNVTITNSVGGITIASSYVNTTYSAGTNLSLVGTTFSAAMGNQWAFTNTTASSSTSTGAVTVAGGVGIAGSLYAGNIFDNGNRVMYVNPRSTADANTFTNSGVYGLDGGNANSPGGYMPMLVARNSGDVGLQIAGGYNSDKLMFRGWSNSGTTWTAWRTVWHNGNASLLNLIDTDIVTPADGSLLRYNTTSQKWANVGISGGGSVTITNSANGITISGTDTNTTYTAGTGLTLSGTQFSLNTTYTDGRYANRSTSATVNRSVVGWYTIAQNSGNRATGTFIVTDVNSSDHQSIHFIAGMHYGNAQDAQITVLNNSNYSSTGPFDKIRMVYNGTYDQVKLQVYISSTSVTVETNLYRNVQTAGWALVDWVLEDAIPTGFSAKEVTINDVDFLVGRSDTDKVEVKRGGHLLATGNISEGGQLLSAKYALSGHTHAVATTGAAGFMSNTDKSKLDGIASGANNYSHPTGDGNLHVPATGTTNNNKFLMAGATAGVISWNTVDFTLVSGTITDTQHGNRGGGSLHAVATTGTAGFMSSTDKSKLDGIASDANNYTHPTGDGNSHVPANGTTNNGRYLRSGSTAGTYTWSQVAWSELSGVPTTFTPASHTHAISDVTNLQTDLNGKLSTTYLTNRSIANADVDDVGVGVYYIASTATNKPTGTDHSLLSLSYNSAWTTQLAGDWRTNKFYTRVQTNGVWSGWETLATESRSILAGTGLSGGGNLTADRTLSLDTTYTDGRYGKVYRITKSVAQNTLQPLAGFATVEAAINILIAVQSNTSSNSGTMTYQYQGGYGQVGTTWALMKPLVYGRGHGDFPNGFDLYVRRHATNVTMIEFAVSAKGATITKTLNVTFNDLTGNNITGYSDISSSATETIPASPAIVYSHRTLDAEALLVQGVTVSLTGHTHTLQSLTDTTIASLATGNLLRYDGATWRNWTPDFQPSLGFTPVQQGGGTGQGTNKVYIGWASDSSGLKLQVDTTDLGTFVLGSRTISAGTGLTGGGDLTANRTLSLDLSYVDNRYLNQQVSGTLDVNAQNGTKLFVGSSASWTNRGTTGHNGSALFSMNTHSGNYYSQFWFDTAGDSFYHRTADNTAWRSWRKVLMEGNNATTMTTTITNATASSSTTTGAFTVTGGVGVGGSLYAGALYDNGLRVLTSLPAHSHSEYLLKAGDSMTGNLNMNGGTAINVRHINGRHQSTNTDDILYLNWSTGYNVHVGSTSTNSNLLVNGNASATSFTEGGTALSSKYAAIGHNHDGTYLSAVAKTTHQNPQHFRKSYFAIGGEAGDTGMTGLYDRNELTNAALRGNVTITITGAGTYNNTAANKNLLFNAKSDIFQISGTDATTTKIEILVDLLENQANYSRGLWQPFVHYRGVGSGYTRYNKITVEMSQNATTWYTATGWSTTNATSDAFPSSMWMGSDASPGSASGYTYRYVRFTLEDRIGAGDANDPALWLLQLGFRHVSSPYARQYLETSGGNVYGDVKITATTVSSSTTTGALTISGGIGVGGASWFGSTLTVTGATQINNTLGVTGVTSITNATAATSTITGALKVSGGVGVAGSLYAGALYDNGNRVLTSLPAHTHSEYVLKTGDTMTGDLLISKVSPTLTLHDTDGNSGTYPKIKFNTANNQPIELSFNEFDGELPTAGTGLIVTSTDSTSNPLSFSVLGNIYAGGTTVATLKRVLHTGDIGTGAAQVAAGNHTHSDYATTSHNHDGVYTKNAFAKVTVGGTTASAVGEDTLTIVGSGATSVSVSGKTITITSTDTDTNTTYAEISEADSDSTTSATLNTITGRRLNSWATRKGFLTTMPTHNHDTSYVLKAGDTMSGDLLIEKNNAWLTLDSSSSGGDGTDQGAGISIGESGKKGAAAIHMTYTGNGYGHIGMGVVDGTSGIPQYNALKFFYTSNAVDILGAATIAGLTTVNNKLIVNNITNATSTDGAIRTSGGISVGLDAYVGGHLDTASGSITNLFNSAKRVNMQSTTMAKYSNARMYTNLTGIQVNSGSITGAIVINTKIGASSMCRINIKGYIYTSGTTTMDITVGFYRYSTNTLSSTSTTYRGKFQPTVRLATDASNNVVIILGDTNSSWSYPNIWVESAIIGHSSGDMYGDDWTMVNGIIDLTPYVGINTPPIEDYVNANLIANGQVSLSKLPNISQNIILGRVSSGSGVVEALSASQLHTVFASTTNSNDYRFIAGDGRGIKYWDSDAYKTYMSVTTHTTWGGRMDTTSDYNMYFRMGGGTNRGFVFQNGTTNTASVAQIDGGGNIYAKGWVDAIRFFGNTGDTAAAPSFTWTTDSNTGIFSAGADQIGFTTGGVARITQTNTTTTISTITNITNATATDATNTGALVVSGGIGVGGSVKVGGWIETPGVVLNNGGGVIALTTGGVGVYGAPANTYTCRVFESYGWNFTVQNIGTGVGAFRIKSADSTAYNNGTTLFSVNESGNAVASGTITATQLYEGNNRVLTSETDTLQSVTARASGNTTNIAVQFTNATASTSTTTGALTVSGGVGIAGAVFASGNVDASKFLGNDADTATAPSFTWTSDDNTGMWRPNADQIGFTTGGTNRITISTTAVTIALATQITNTLDVNRGGLTFNATTPGTTKYNLHFGGVTTNDHAEGITWGGSGSATNAQAGIYVQSSGGYGTRMYFGTTGNYGTGSISRMSIDSTGFISMLANLASTSTSTGTLRVTGGVGVSGSLYAAALYDNGLRVLTGESDTLATVTGRGATTATAVQFTNTTVSTSTTTGAVRITGGLGVGGSVYAAALYDNGLRVLTGESDTLATVTGRGATTATAVQFTNTTVSTSTTTGAVRISGGLGVAGAIWANTIETTSLIRSSGNIVAINNSSIHSGSGQTQLALNYGGGALVLENGGLNGSNGAPAGTSPVRAFESYGWVFTIPSSSGSLGGFRLKSPESTLYNNGTTYFEVTQAGNATASGNITAYSDARLKTNVQSYESGLDKVLALRPVTYDRIDVEKHESGFIAQEVQAIDQSLVIKNTDENETLSLDYSRITVMLTKAVQEQQDIIKKQQEMIEMLTKRIDDLGK